MDRFLELNKVRLYMFLPSNDAVLPWTALLLGLWIPNFYYWGLNQYITQRTLGSASLAEGQKGIVFSAFMKLLIPFVIVIPGIIAFNLFAPDLKLKATGDNAGVFAKYLKANPDTAIIKTVVSPSAEEIAGGKEGNLIVAVYPDAHSLKAAHTRNPYVLPITQEGLNKIEVKPYSVFKSDDKSMNTVFPALAAELDVYNKATEQAARAAGVSVNTEKFVGYKYDSALGQLLSKVLPRNTGLVGFVLAALLGAIVSSLAAMLNAASTIFTMDVYKKYLNPQADQKMVVMLGRICVVVFSVIAVLLAPKLGDPKFSHSIFTIIQESQGFLSPGILAVFAFGLVFHKAPRFSGVLGLLTGIAVYGGLKYVSTINKLMEIPQMELFIGNFLNRMAITFFVCLLVMLVSTMLKPLAQPVEFKLNTKIELHTSQGAKVAGIFVVIITLILYFIFSPMGIAR
jgi:SSS family solute:Na+ symporter